MSGPDDRDSKGSAARLSAIKSTADTRFIKAAFLFFGRADAQPAADGRIARLFRAADFFAGTGFEIFRPAGRGETEKEMPEEG